MAEKHHIYWVGPRKSDIAAVSDIEFYGSVTIFGDDKDNNYSYCGLEGKSRVNHNVSDKEEDAFFLRKIGEIIKEDPSARFYFYNPQAVFFIEGLSAYRKYFLAVNEESVMLDAVSKPKFREFLAGTEVPLLQIEELNRSNCDYMSLVEKFGLSVSDGKRFIFQAPVSSGGNGTFVVSRDTGKDVINLLSANVNYIVSVYRENNVPINIHAVIFDDEILLTPGSVQIMKGDDNRLLYRGADYIAYRSIPKALRDKFREHALTVCKVFQSKGYRGVCGIDGIIANGDIRILELNNRFQASTGLLDLALADNGLPSLQKINLAAFEKGGWKEAFRKIENIEVNYSNFFYTDNGTKFHSNHIYEVCKDPSRRPKEVAAVEEDGYKPEQRTDALAYLYRLTFRTNITALTPEGALQINENVCEPPKAAWYDKLAPALNENVFGRSVKEIRDYLLKLKVALLTQGVVVERAAEDAMKEKNGFRPATNNAIDLRVDLPAIGKATNKYLIINAPVDILFVEFSPFRLSFEKLTEAELAAAKEGSDEKTLKGRFRLHYYAQEKDGVLTNAIGELTIGTYPLDPVSVELTKNGAPIERRTTRGTPYKEVAFLSTDRLRVHLTNSCIFKCDDKDGKFQGCMFCNIDRSSDVLKLEDIEEIVKEYCLHSGEIGLTHFLVGGQTAPEGDKDKLIDIIRIIRKYARFAPIYAMVIPYSNETIRKMYDAGLNQISMNVEVFDDATALDIMPGKRATVWATYLARLKYATTLFGRKGNVRSMVIVGLERHKSFIDGIKELAAGGIQPILSIFRPLPGTPLEDRLAPSMLSVTELYDEVQRICREKGLNAGPDCVNCQNNTLALPVWLEDLAAKA